MFLLIFIGNIYTGINCGIKSTSVLQFVKSAHTFDLGGSYLNILIKLNNINPGIRISLNMYIIVA